MKTRNPFQRTAFLLLLAYWLVQPSFLASAQGLNLPGGITATATGTGETTGIVAELTITNTTQSPVSFTLGPLFIPSDGEHQSYIVPGSKPVEVAPGATLKLPLDGFCVDINRPPVPAGVEMPHPSTWVTPSPLPAGWRPSTDKGWKPKPESTATIPGTNTPLGHTINIDRNPAEAVSILIDAIENISVAFDGMIEEGSILTPFAARPDHEREVVIQQTFWVFTSILAGLDYEKEDFRENTITQFEENTGQDFETQPEEVRESIEFGVNTFWETFQAVGEGAKVFRSSSESIPKGTCRILCPPSDVFVERHNVAISWECGEGAGGPFSISLFSENLPTIEITGITDYSVTLDQPLEGMRSYEIVLQYQEGNDQSETPKTPLNTHSDCCSSLAGEFKKLDSLYNLVKGASSAFEANPLVKNVRLMNMVIDLLSNPQEALDMFDEWLNEKFEMPVFDSHTGENWKYWNNYLSSNLNNIKTALEYAKKIIEFVGSQTDKDTGALTGKIDSALKLFEVGGNYEDLYDELRDAITDLKGFLGDKIKDFVQSKLKEAIERILIEKIGTAGAGAIMSIASDAYNFVDALIQQNNLEEARRMYQLMFLGLLEKAKNCYRYGINDDWNNYTINPPHVFFDDCRQVEGKKVKLEAVIQCWVPKLGGKPGEGSWQEKKVNFDGGKPSVEKRKFRSDCSKKCHFNFKLDMKDLADKSSGCEQTYVEIKVTVNGKPSGSLFAGVYSP